MDKDEKSTSEKGEENSLLLQVTSINSNKHHFTIRPVSQLDQDQCTTNSVNRLTTYSHSNTLQPPTALAAAAGLHCSTNNTDTINSVRSRHLSFSRPTYTLDNFNNQFDRVEDTNKSNAIKKIATTFNKKQQNGNGNSALASSQTALNRKKNNVNNNNKCNLLNGKEQNDLSHSRRSSDSSNISQMSPIGITSDDDEGDTDDVYDGFVDGKCKKRTKYSHGKDKIGSYFTKLFPIVNSFKNYSKEHFISDCISALTVIVFHVPQSMGYSLIAQGKRETCFEFAIFSSFLFFFLPFVLSFLCFFYFYSLFSSLVVLLFFTFFL